MLVDCWTCLLINWLVDWLGAWMNGWIRDGGSLFVMKEPLIGGTGSGGLLEFCTPGSELSNIMQ